MTRFGKNPNLLMRQSEGVNHNDLKRKTPAILFAGVLALVILSGAEKSRRLSIF